VKGADFTVLAAPRRYLAPIEDIIDIISKTSLIVIVIAILLVLEFSVSSYTAWDCVVPSMVIIVVVLSLFEIEGSGISERHIPTITG
jgi:hypothetical protein